MVARVLGAQHHRPLRVRVDQGLVVCPLTRRVQGVASCTRCPNLQGSLEGILSVVLCAAPARRSRWPRRGHALVFDTDCPDEPD
jgi:hypothetical protein